MLTSQRPQDIGRINAVEYLRRTALIAKVQRNGRTGAWVTLSADLNKRAVRLKKYGSHFLLASGALIIGWLLFAAFKGDPMRGGYGLLAIASSAASAGFYARARVIKSKAEIREADEMRLRDADAAASAEEIERAATAEELGRKLQQLSDTHSEVNQLVQQFPALLQAVSSSLDLCDQEFRRGAFSPFWSSVESTTERLGEISESLNHFHMLADLHVQMKQDLVDNYKAHVNVFPVRLRDLQIAEQAQQLSQRMDSLVGKAQTNFQFASIYEQRRTNALLIAGFSNLGQAIYGMTSMITDKLAGVVTAIDAASATSEAQGKSAIAQSEEAIAMLNNIQKRRLPYGASRDY